MPVTVQQLEYFLAAVEHGSLSAAAESCFVAQPSLSEQVRRLEGQLGVTLFLRTNRRLILTEAARLLLPHAQRAVEAVAEATASVEPMRTMTGGHVAFGTFSVAHHLCHDEVVADFRALHPLVRVRLVAMNSADVVDAVREGELEAGLVALPVDDRGLDVGPVVWSSEAVYLSTRRELVKTPPDVRVLAERDLILPEARRRDLDPTRRLLLERSQQAGVRLEPVVDVESPVAALALAARGLGDTVVSLPLAQRLGWTEQLRWISLDPPLVETFAFVKPRGAALTPAATALMTLMTRYLSALR